MAKRKSINKRLSRYSRSSVGSGFLDPNSEVFGEEEPFWWNNLTNNANRSLVKYNSANQTSKYLDSNSEAELSDVTNAWWNVLDTTDSEVSNNLHIVQKAKQPDMERGTIEPTMSDSDEDDSLPPPQKKKITMRGKSRESKSNPFLKAFIDSDISKLAKSIQDSVVTKPANDTSVSNESSKKSDFKEDYKSPKNNVNVSASIDHSHSTDEILKLKPQVFRKRNKGEKENVFEDLLKSTEDKHNDIVATEIVPVNSSNKLIERNDVFEKNVSKQFIINSNISKQDGNHIYHERSDSSFEIQSDHIHDALQKESSMSEDHKSQTIENSTYSSKEVNTHTSNKTTESPDNNDENEKLFKSTNHIHTLNNSNINQNHTYSSINNSKQSFNIIDQETIDKEAVIQKSNVKNVISESLSTNKTLTNPVNTSPKNTETDLKSDSTNIRTSLECRNNTINSSARNVTKNFANNCLTNDNKINDSLKEVSTVNDRNKTILAKDAIRYNSNNNEEPEAQLSTTLHTRISVHSTDSLNEKSSSKSNDKTQPEGLDMYASTSKQKPKIITNSFTNNDCYNADENNQFSDKTINATNFGQQKRINEYFGPISPKLTSTKVKKSKNVHLIKTKEDEEIKKRLEQKKQKLDKYFSKTPLVTQLTGKELKERIQKLENERTKKLPVKAEIHPAYLVNGKQYKRPKLPRPQPWVTDRFYSHLWKIMEPKFKLLTRVKSEKFVNRLSSSVSIIIKSKEYEDYKDELDDLMKNMARLGIIHTRNDFYDFCYEFLPYDFRVKVIPMIMPGNVKNIPYDPKKLHEPLLVE